MEEGLRGGPASWCGDEEHAEGVQGSSLHVAAPPQVSAMPPQAMLTLFVAPHRLQEAARLEEGKRLAKYDHLEYGVM